MFSMERQLISDVELWTNQLCQGTSENTAALKSTQRMERYSQGCREMQESQAVSPVGAHDVFFCDLTFDTGYKGVHF